MNIFTIFVMVLLAATYAWTFYNLPVMLIGIRKYRSRKEKGPVENQESTPEEDLPSFSVVIPAKNEELVLPRLLESTFNQEYPREKVEVIIVEDGSTDATLEVCERFAQKKRGRIKVIHSETSEGKPSALNKALKASTGDIVAVFDADSIPEKDILLKAAKRFQDGSIDALQGRTLTANSDVNMLTKFLSYEETVWLEGYMGGKDALNLFVHLKGSCQFIRRKALQVLGGWSEGHLCEDMEISARLTEKGYKIKYAPEVRSWQETTETFGQMLRQRVRWFRGTMEVALRYGRLLRKPSFRTFDAEATFFGPFVLIISLLTYAFSPLTLSELGESMFFMVTLFGWTSFTASLFVAALALLYIAQPKRLRDCLWLPFIYAYWTFQVFLAAWAFIKILCKSSKEWKKTTKSGRITNTGAIPQISPSVMQTKINSELGSSRN